MAALKDYYTVKLHDTDAAGILFFANQFKIIHDVYEDFLARNGFAFRDRIERLDFFIPIVHAETDYRHPLTVGDTVEVALSIKQVGDSSFTLAYVLTFFDGTVVGNAETVHVTIDATTRAKISLPEQLRRKLTELADL